MFPNDSMNGCGIPPSTSSNNTSEARAPYELPQQHANYSIRQARDTPDAMVNSDDMIALWMNDRNGCGIPPSNNNPPSNNTAEARAHFELPQQHANYSIRQAQDTPDAMVNSDDMISLWMNAKVSPPRRSSSQHEQNSQVANQTKSSSFHSTGKTSPLSLSPSTSIDKNIIHAVRKSPQGKEMMNSMFDMHPQASKSHQNTFQQYRISHQNTLQAAGHSAHQDYKLGDAARSRHHMVIERTRSKATQAVDTLSKNDFAFIKRSNGSYTYAMLCYRTKSICKGVQQELNSISFSSLSISPRGGPAEEETMTFVLHDDGRAKVINKSQWGNYVRLISTKVATSSRSRTNGERSEKAMINVLPPAIQHKQDKACDMKKDPPFVSSSVPLHEKYDAEYVQHWERITLSHFRTSSWEEVVQAGLKVLQVPSQTETNFDVLYEVGYAYMRLSMYDTSALYLQKAHRIDSQHVSLKLVMRDLRRKVTTGPWRNRGRRSR